MASDPSAMITALEAALGSGEQSIEVNGDKVVYRSVKDLRDALAYYRRQLAVTAGKARTTFAKFG